MGPFNTSNYVMSKQFFDKILTLELNEEKGTQENAGVDGGGLSGDTTEPDMEEYGSSIPHLFSEPHLLPSVCEALGAIYRTTNR